MKSKVPLNLEDEKIYKLMELLISNPRMSAKDLSKATNINRNTCAELIQKIFTEKYLTVAPNTRKAKYSIYKFVLIKLITSNGIMVGRFRHKLLSMDNVIACYFVEGNYDYIVVFGFESQQQFAKMLEEMQTIGEWDKSETITIIRDVKPFEVALRDLI